MATETEATLRATLTIPEPAKVGRQRLIGVAMRLFYEEGISPIGLDRVISECGVTKTTFYKHFRSKTDLVIATIHARHEWQMKAWRDAVRIVAGDDPREQLVGMFDVLDSTFNEPSFHGCHFVNAAAEFPNPNDPIHRAAAHHKRESHAWFRELAERAGAEPLDEFVDAYVLLFEGTLVLRRVGQRSDVARAARPHVQRLLEAYLP